MSTVPSPTRPPAGLFDALRNVQVWCPPCDDWRYVHLLRPPRRNAVAHSSCDHVFVRRLD